MATKLKNGVFEYSGLDSDLHVRGNLTVDGDLVVVDDITLDDATVENLTLTGAATPTLTITDTTNTVSVVGKSDDTKGYLGTSTNHALDILTNNTARIAIANSGATTLSGAVTCSSTLAVTGALSVTGNITAVGAAGETMVFKEATVNHTIVGGGLTETVSALVPAGARVLGVVARITTIIVLGGGGASWSLGDGTDADLYGTGLALASGTTIGPTDWTASPFTHAWSASAGDLVMTANAGTFTSGAVRFTVSYIDFTAPTS